jgi:sugar phosphate isomerase/epimerase
MLYVYAVAADLGDVTDLTGVQGEPLMLIPVVDAVAVAGGVDAQPPLDAPALKAQDALVRQLHDRAGALLPMRFGMTARDADALGRSLEALRDIGNKLAAVRACEQMTLRVVSVGGAERAGGAESAEGAGTAAASGTEYLKARAERRKASPELAAIAGAAASLQRDVRIDPANQQGLHGSVYHLIERGRSGEYRAAIDRAAAGLPNVRILISGPSPAYAFA